MSNDARSTTTDPPARPATVRTGAVETHGLDRIPAAERHGRPSSLFWVWASANVIYIYFVLGGLLVLLGLGIWEALAITVVGNIWWAAVGWIATSGPASGTPAVVIFRSMFGVRGNRVFGAGLNVLIGVFFEIVNIAFATLAALAFLAHFGLPVGPGTEWIVLVVVAVGSFIVSVYGHDMILRLSPIFTAALAVCFVLLAVFVLGAADLGFTPEPLPPADHTALVLLGYAIVAATPLSWCTSADFSRYLPSNTPKREVVLWTALGGFIPAVLITALGIAAATAIDMTDPQLTLVEIVPDWFYPVFLFVIVLGSVTNNVLTAYTTGLCFEALGVRVSRAWATVITGAMATAIAALLLFGAPSFLDTLAAALEISVTVLGPLLAIYVADVIVRRGRYDGRALCRRESREPVLVPLGPLLAGHHRPHRCHGPRPAHREHDPVSGTDRRGSRRRRPLGDRRTARGRRRLRSALAPHPSLLRPRRTAGARRRDPGDPLMTWTMPAETAPHERIWMSFPREGQTLGETATEREAGYAAWTAVAHAVAEFEPVTMIVDPSETARARRMLGSGIELVERTIDDFWMRDSGPTFVRAADGSLAAVDWIFNGWGGNEWTSWENDKDLARFVAGLAGIPIVSSMLVNEGGGIHVDGEGTVLVTETVQLDPGRNPHADKPRVEAELARTLGTTSTIWLPRGLTRDYDAFGTRGHVDIVATIPSPGTILLHRQPDPAHPDHAVTRELRAQLEQATDAAERRFEIIDVPAPQTLKDDEGFVDWSYINHLVVNGGVIACGFGEERADARAREILAEAYPGRRVVSVDARELFARGGGIHCITQQQPTVVEPVETSEREGDHA